MPASFYGPYLLTISSNSRVTSEIERALSRVNPPHTNYNKEEIEGYRSEIQQILDILYAQNTSPSENSAVVRADVAGNATDSVAETGTALLFPIHPPFSTPTLQQFGV